MADGTIKVVESTSTGKNVDNSLLTVGGTSVYRQRISIGSAETSDQVPVLASTPASSDFGLVVRIAGAAAGSTLVTITNTAFTVTSTSAVVSPATGAIFQVQASSSATQPVSGVVALSSGTVTLSSNVVAVSSATVTFAAAQTLAVTSGTVNVQVVSTSGGTLTLGDFANNAIRVNQVASTAVQAVSQSGAWTFTSTASTVTPGSGAIFQVVASTSGTQPVSGTVAATQSGAWTFTSTATTVSPASGSIFQIVASTSATQPVSGTVTVGTITSLTSALVNVSQVGAVAITLGQKAMASAFPVVVSSDQTAIPVTQSGTWTFTTTSSVSSSVSVVTTSGGTVNVGDFANNAVKISSTGLTISGSSATIFGASQATAANLNATVVGTSATVFGASQATAGNLNATVVQGTASATPWPTYNASTSGGNSVGVAGVAVPVSAQVVGGNDGALTRALAVDGAGNQKFRKPGNQWRKTGTAAAATIVTINQAAGAAGVRNVCNDLSYTLTSTAAPTIAGAMEIAVFDGTSSGSRLWSNKVTMPAVAGQMATQSLTDIWIEGTAATAMTLCTVAAPWAAVIGTLSFGGCTITT